VKEGPTTIERRKGQPNWSGSESLLKRIRFVTSNRSLRNEMTVKGMFAGLQQFEIADPTQELNVADEFNKAINSELIERLKALDQEQSLEKITKEIEEEYRRGLVDLDKDIRLDFERDNPVYFIDPRGREVPISVLSAGEREFLYFFAYLRRIRNDRDRIILIDEPELHLHGNQVRKLCEMLAELSEYNQVIIATHSSDVLHHFLRGGNIVRLGDGVMRNINFPDDMRMLMDQIGLPIDPSVFTAHWIVAENKDSISLPGEGGPVTSEVLSWIFGRNIARRFWGFGSSRASAEGQSKCCEPPQRTREISDSRFCLMETDSWQALPTGPRQPVTSTLNPRFDICLAGSLKTSS
jgi:hypothetical protein